jgi:hypothetical protein
MDVYATYITVNISTILLSSERFVNTDSGESQADPAH